MNEKAKKMSDIIKAIAIASGNDAYYLKSLNTIDEVDFSIYEGLQEKYSDTEILGLLGALDWRLHLIAYAYAMPLSKSEFLPALVEAVKAGSFITPQLVVAIARLGKTEYATTLETLAGDPSTSSKTRGAIFAVLPACSVDSISLSNVTIDIEEFKTGMATASTHLQYWVHRSVSSYIKGDVDDIN